MGYKLRREIADRLPPSLSSGERLVVLEIADQANDMTRQAFGRDLLDIVARRTGFAGTKQVGKVLGKLAEKGIELRVQIVKNGRPLVDRRGRPVFAYEGHQTTYRIPVFDPVVSPPGDHSGADDSSEVSREGDHSGAEVPPSAPSGPPPGPRWSPAEGSVLPPAGDPSPHLPSESPHLSSVDARSEEEKSDLNEIVEDRIIELLAEHTGRSVKRSWASRVRREILDGRDVRDPVRYVAAAVKSEPFRYAPQDAPWDRRVPETGPADPDGYKRNAARARELLAARLRGRT
ncbi:hypothetical protein ABGB12_26410 [Actinocorallia sp. B10E7]|uniref:hypothetical protein n=1 Tax=Actinocorallia sp. B10E7 TaxID=3153558 RepID=UPI00325C78D2